MPLRSDSQGTEGTVIRFQSDDEVREKGRVLVASGGLSRNRDFWTGKAYRLVPSGMRLENWQKNPLIFYMHHMGIPLAKAEMFLEGGQLWALDDFEFHRKEVPVFNMFGFGSFDTNAIAELWEERFLNAVSIHIILSKQDEEAIVETEDEILIPVSEVIEASVVTVPGDPAATREEEEFLAEFQDRLRRKGVPKEMAECVACSTVGELWTPNLPIWRDTSKQAVTSDRSLIFNIQVPEVSMSKTVVEKTKLETAQAAEATPVEPAAEPLETAKAAEATPIEPAAEPVVDVTLKAEELVIEEEFELPILVIAEAISNDTQALNTIANALVQSPDFVEHIMTALGGPAQVFEPILQEAEILPRKVTIKLVGSGPSPAEQAPLAQPVQRPVAVKQAVQQAVAPVATPVEQLNGVKPRKPNVLDLMRDPQAIQ